MRTKSVAKYNGCLQLIGLPFVLLGILLAFLGVMIFAGQPVGGEPLGMMAAIGFCGGGALLLFGGGALCTSKKIWLCPQCGATIDRA